MTYRTRLVNIVTHGHPHDPVLDRLKHENVGLDDEHILRTDDGEDSHDTGTEKNLGDGSERGTRVLHETRYSMLAIKLQKNIFKEWRRG